MSVSLIFKKFLRFVSLFILTSGYVFAVLYITTLTSFIYPQSDNFPIGTLEDSEEVFLLFYFTSLTCSVLYLIINYFARHNYNSPTVKPSKLILVTKSITNIVIGFIIFFICWIMLSIVIGGNNVINFKVLFTAVSTFLFIYKIKYVEENFLKISALTFFVSALLFSILSGPLNPKDDYIADQQLAFELLDAHDQIHLYILNSELKKVPNEIDQEILNISSSIQYTRLSDTEYLLCTNFKRPRQPGFYDSLYFWPHRGRCSDRQLAHPAGEHCLKGELMNPSKTCKF